MEKLALLSCGPIRVAWPMVEEMKAALHSVLRSFGVDIVRYDPRNFIGLRRGRILDAHQITLVLDVGANIGQYARQLREVGYAGRIVSFEPLSKSFRRLSRRAMTDRAWECRQLALGDTDGSAEMHISRNPVASSLLPICARSIAANADTAYVGREKASVARLDSLWSELATTNDRVFLKLDVQGYEMQVLRGAAKALPNTSGIETELSLVPLYEGQALFHEMLDFLESAGFDLVSLERGMTDRRTGEVLQVDGIFVRRSDS